MSSAHPHTQHPEFNPKVHDPIMAARRNRLDEQPDGKVMHPVHISLVIGQQGSGVSTLLNAFRKRADMESTLIVDEDQDGGPLKAWDSEQIAAWLKDTQTRQQADSTSIVLASSDLRAPRHLLQALAGEPALGALFRLDAVTGATSSVTGPEAADQVCAGSDGTIEREEAPSFTLAIDPQRRRLFATADRIVLTHTDRARPETVTRLARALKALNPPAPILRARNGDIGPARLVDSGLFDPVTGGVDIDRWLCEAACRDWRNLSVSAFPGPSNDIDVRFFVITLDQPLDATTLAVFLKLLMADRGTDLLRLKGIVATKDHPDRPALIDAREQIIQPLLWLETWPTADRRTRLVFSTSDSSEAWIRMLLTTLSDQFDLAERLEVQLAQVEKVG